MGIGIFILSEKYLRKAGGKSLEVIATGDFLVLPLK